MFSETLKENESQQEPQINPEAQDQLNDYIDNKLKFFSEIISSTETNLRDWARAAQWSFNTDSRIHEELINHQGIPEHILRQAPEMTQKLQQDLQRTQGSKIRWQMIQRIVNDEEFNDGEQKEFIHQVNNMGISDRITQEQRGAILLNFINLRIQHKTEQIEERDKGRLHPDNEYKKKLEKAKDRIRAMGTHHTNERRIEQLAIQNLTTQGITPPSWWKTKVKAGVKERVKQKSPLPRKEGFEIERDKLTGWKRKLTIAGFKELGTTKVDFGD